MLIRAVRCEWSITGMHRMPKQYWRNGIMTTVTVTVTVTATATVAGTVAVAVAVQWQWQSQSRSRSRSRFKSIYFSNIEWRKINDQSQPSWIGIEVFIILICLLTLSCKFISLKLSISALLSFSMSCHDSWQCESAYLSCFSCKCIDVQVCLVRDISRVNWKACCGIQLFPEYSD